jgi:hypothetical protein
MEEIYISCDIEDCLLYCQIYDSYRDTFKYKYVLSKKNVTLHKKDPDLYCDFVLSIFNMFNVPLKIIIQKNASDQIETNINILLLEYPLKLNSLSKYIPIANTEFPNEYIVINLNIRILKETQDINSITFMLNKLVYILNTTNFNIPLVIIGHQQTFELNNIINYSFYDQLILTKFIDKSYNNDLLNKPNIDKLIYDINILKNAKETFQFGIGSSLYLNVIFSNNLSCIFNSNNESIYEYFSTKFLDLNKNIKFYENKNELLEILQNYSNNNIKNISSYDNLIDILNKNNYQHIIDNNQDKECIAIGIGDILFKLVNLENNLVNKPVYINLDIFQSGLYKINKTSKPQVWFDNPYNNFIFRINLLNDIIENSIYFEKKDFIFVITPLNAAIISKTNITFNLKKLKKYNLLMNDKFYTNNDLKQSVQYLRNTIQQFIKTPFIIFHTKLRLNSNYDYKQIKEHLNLFFSGFKIKKFNIILLGEQKFKPTTESNVQGITTIYPELLKLYNYNSNKILDLTKEYIYNELNYDEYKNDICLIHKAEYNICYGQGGQLCSSLLFGKCIFFDPIDEEYFFQNTNLYNSGHRYFKKLDMINKYLLQIL